MRGYINPPFKLPKMAGMIKMSYEIFGTESIKAVRSRKYDGDGNEYYTLTLNIKANPDTQDTTIRFYSKDKVDIDVKDFI